MQKQHTLFLFILTSIVLIYEIYRKYVETLNNFLIIMWGKWHILLYLSFANHSFKFGGCPRQPLQGQMTFSEPGWSVMPSEGIIKVQRVIVLMNLTLFYVVFSWMFVCELIEFALGWVGLSSWESTVTWEEREHKMRKWSVAIGRVCGTERGSFVRNSTLCPFRNKSLEAGDAAGKRSPSRLRGEDPPFRWVKAQKLMNPVNLPAELTGGCECGGSRPTQQREESIFDLAIPDTFWFSPSESVTRLCPLMWWHEPYTGAGDPEQPSLRDSGCRESSTTRAGCRHWLEGDLCTSPLDTLLSSPLRQIFC